MFGIVDCNSFFASCEKVFVPRLWDKPVVVLSNNDGCVVARSPEAKKLGIAMGVPFFQIRSLCDSRNVAVFSSNFELYADMSRRVMACLRQWTPFIEVYSIDEAFLNLDSTPDSETEAFRHHVVHTIRRWTGIPVSFGVAPTKTLAKVAVHKAKEAGVESVLLDGPAETRLALETIPVGDVWGVGRKLREKLMRSGIRSAWDLSQCDPIAIRREYSIVLERTVRELRGESCLELEDYAPPKYSIQHSRSFGRKVENPAELCEAVSSFLDIGAAKLRRYKLYAEAIQITLYGNLKEGRGGEGYTPWCDSATIPLESAQNDTFAMIPHARRCVENLFREEVSYKKAAVTFLSLTNTRGESKYRLFDSPEKQAQDDARDDARARLLQTIDTLRRELGNASVLIAAEGLPSERHWKSRQDRKSPAYTTKWSDIPQVK
ncbi:MAG: Y-family DNA polymerase [Planctomycetia bacterium]|nr:Y-family DNA polymerase [Planctomycetia bacterium]